jgi:hypothetical protein
LDPEDIDAWLLLAQSYKSQAEDHLMMHASEIMKIKKTVANLQRRSYLCFTQVIKLFQRESKAKLKKLYMLKSREELAQTVWADFGFVCQSLVSQPMDGRITTLQMSDKTHILCRLSQIAKETEHIISLDNAENARELLSPDKINLQDRQRAIMLTASFAFKKASLLDDSKWTYHHMLAHFYAKLGRKSSVRFPVLSFYIL